MELQEMEPQEGSMRLPQAMRPIIRPFVGPVAAEASRKSRASLEETPIGWLASPRLSPGGPGVRASSSPRMTRAPRSPV